MGFFCVCVWPELAYCWSYCCAYANTFNTHLHVFLFIPSSMHEAIYYLTLIDRGLWSRDLGLRVNILWNIMSKGRTLNTSRFPSLINQTAVFFVRNALKVTRECETWKKFPGCIPPTPRQYKLQIGVFNSRLRGWYIAVIKKWSMKNIRVQGLLYIYIANQDY